MRTWAPREVQKAVYQRLYNDVELATLLGAYTPADPPTIPEPIIEQKVFDFVPQDFPYPFVTMQVFPFTNRGNRTKQGLSVEFQISVWHRVTGSLIIQNIQNRIDQLFHRKNICIDGWGVVSLERTFIGMNIETDNVTRQGIQRFSLFIAERDKEE